MSDCRSCTLAKEDFCSTSHALLEAEFVCLLCGHTGMGYVHRSEELYGVSIDCPMCRNFILYTNDDGIPYKDECYLEKPKTLVIRNFEHNTTSIVFRGDMSYQDKTLIGIEGILKIESLSQLTDKVKTMVVFS